MGSHYMCRLLFVIMVVVISDDWWVLGVLGLGSMSSMAISYGEFGAVICCLKNDGSHRVSCHGSNSAIVYGAPPHLTFEGLSGGDGFMCGLLMHSRQPYCWGNSGYIQMGVVPVKKYQKGLQYLEISAGDHHLCASRSNSTSSSVAVDCWGYNMTVTHALDAPIKSISAGSEFNCALFSVNKTVFCWGDQISSRVITLIPRNQRFRLISSGGYHVCGILEGANSRALCWGKSAQLSDDDDLWSTVDLAPIDPMMSVVGAKFHACGIRSFDRGIICWGFRVKNSTPVPDGIRVYEMAAGDYFTCGIVADQSLRPVCWGLGFPSTLPLAASPGICRPLPCPFGSYQLNATTSPCKSPNTKICLPCSNACPLHMYRQLECTTTSDLLCGLINPNCTSPNCPAPIKDHNHWSVQLVVIAAEIVFVVLMVGIVSLTAVLYVRYRLRNCHCSRDSNPRRRVVSRAASASSSQQKAGGVTESPVSRRRARRFSYGELERATGGFKDESQVGKGSFSCVFKGVLEDGTVVAVKRAIIVSSSDLKKNSKEFHTELDLLSRLNHAHLLNLLGYCEEGGERLLVYEFMAHGSLHQYLHGKEGSSSEHQRLDWVRRVTIAVQAARGIEYLHGYACPPVIHRDIKSSNILIDQEHNARVSDFGLSLLGPADSSSPLAELPAGTLGYLDPEYYRLHYLTTKSDVYSFGVLLLEILSGRKAIDMRFDEEEEGNIVEWAVPLIKAGNVSAVLDPTLDAPLEMEALKRIANVAVKCVRMRGKERPSMDKVTTGLERALALLMGSPCNEQPILPTEVVLGSSRMHKKSSQRSSNRSAVSENNILLVEGEEEQFRAPSWITFPSVTSSQRRRSSASEADVVVVVVDEGKSGALRSCLEEEEIGPASPQQNMFLQHNF